MTDSGEPTPIAESDEQAAFLSLHTANSALQNAINTAKGASQKLEAAKESREKAHAGLARARSDAILDPGSDKKVAGRQETKVDEEERLVNKLQSELESANKKCQSLFADHEKSLTKAFGALKSICGRHGIILDFEAGYTSVGLRIYDRDTNETFRRMLNAVSVDQMEEEGDANTYYTSLEKQMTQAKRRVDGLINAIDFESGSSKARDLDPFYTDLTIEGGDKKPFAIIEEAIKVREDAGQHLSSTGGANGPVMAQLNILAMTSVLKHVSSRLKSASNWLDQNAVREKITGALKQQANDCEEQSRGLAKRLLSNSFIFWGVVTGFALWLFAHSRITGWIDWESARRLSWFSLLGPVLALLCLKRLERIGLSWKVEKVRNELKNHIRWLLNPLSVDEKGRTPRSILAELEFKNVGVKPLSSGGRTDRSFEVQEAVVKYKFGSALRWFFSAVVLTVIICALPALVLFGKYGFDKVVGLKPDRSAEAMLVHFLAMSPGRESCRIAFGNLIAEDLGTYYIKEYDREISVEVPKVQVAKLIYAKPDALGATVQDCSTVVDTYKAQLTPALEAPDVINRIDVQPADVHVSSTPPAVNVNVTPPEVNVDVSPPSVINNVAGPTVIVPPAEGSKDMGLNMQVIALVGEQTSQPTPAAPPAVTYIVIDGREVVPQPESGERLIVLPFFPRDEAGVVSVLDDKDAKRERENVLTYYLQGEDSVSVSRMPKYSSRYIQLIQSSLADCMEPGTQLELDVMGFASARWDKPSAHSTVNTPEVLNHLLAEGRRLAVLRLLGFKDNNLTTALSGNKEFLLVSNNVQDGRLDQDLAVPLHRFRDFEEMRRNGLRYFLPDSHDGTDGQIQQDAREVMDRAVVIGYKDSQLKKSCQLSALPRP